MNTLITLLYYFLFLVLFHFIIFLIISIFLVEVYFNLSLFFKMRYINGSQVLLRGLGFLSYFFPFRRSFAIP